MKIKFKVNSGCEIEQDVRDTKQAFAFIAYAQEVFGVKKCGNCESPNVRLCYREPQGYQYYSVRCDDCKHELKFGQQKDSGRLFPKGWEAAFKNDEDDKPVRRRRQKPAYHNEQEEDEQEYAPAGEQPTGADMSIPW